MARIRYVGPFDAVDVPGLGLNISGIVDCPDDLAASLLEQEDNWKPAKAAKSKDDDK